jgi:iron-sulfur cluster assembly protein
MTNLINITEKERPMPVNLTERAAEQIAKVMLEEGMNAIDNGVRVGVKGGGCSGLQYDMSFVDGPNESDFGEEQHGVNVIIDPFSAAHLEGTIIDYVETLLDAGFKFENPQATRTCGCGSSFSP